MKILKSRAWSLVIVVICSVSIGAGVALLARPAAPASPAPFPGVSYDGKPYSCAQVGYGSGETSFYRCSPLG